MSTRIRVRDGRVEITTAAPPSENGWADALVERVPVRTALVEAAGAQLTWDVMAHAPLPDADVYDALAASAWLADVYGAAVADAVFRGIDVVAALDASGDPRIIDAVRALGHLNWARAWWPASSGIRALDTAIVAAEVAVTSHLLTHLLDDEDAVEHAVADAAEAPAALAALPPALVADAAELAAALDALADDHGVAWEIAAPAEVRSEGAHEWALAAGGEHQELVAEGVVIAQGAAPVRWSDVPAQTVDAAAEAQWTLLQGTDAPLLRVEVRAVHGVLSTTALHARFGPADLELDVVLQREESRFVGERVVPASALFLPPVARTLRVHDPLRVSPETPETPESAEDRAQVLAFAASRLTAPEASLAERAAGTRA